MHPEAKKTLHRLTLLLPALLFMGLVSLPYLAASRAGGEAYVFSGFLLNPIDGNTYLAKMLQGWEGSWRYTLAYTAEPGEGGYLFLFYLFLGQLARWTGLAPLTVFHLARILAAAALLFALYRFLKRALPHRESSTFAFWLAALGSGMGWLSVPFGGFTSDLWVAETYPFLSAYATPHFALGLALLLVLLTLPGETSVGGETFSGEQWLRRMAAGGLRALPAALALAILSPFGAVVAGAALAGLWVWDRIERRRGHGVHPDEEAELLGRLMGIGVGGGPLLVYYLWLTRSDVVLAGWNAQNLTPSPVWWDLLLSLSPALIVALLTLRGAAQPERRPQRLLWVWAGLGLALLYLPWGLQRRFMMGLYVPLAGLAGAGLAALKRKLPRAGALPLLVFLLALPSNLLVLLAANHGMQTHDPLLYLSREEAEAMDWIDAHTPPDALVLAAPDSGLFIPALTGRRVIYGHPFETVPAEPEAAAVQAFFSGGELPGGSSAAEWLEERHVDYIFAGPREAALGGLPAALPDARLSLKFESGDTRVYAVRP